MEFKFLGKMIPTSEKMEEYRKYRCAFSEIASNECEVFEDKYWMVNSLENVRDEIEKWGKECINNAIKGLVGLLVEQEIMTVSASFLQQQYDIEDQFEKPLIAALKEAVDSIFANADNDPEAMDYIYSAPQFVCFLRVILFTNILDIVELYVDILNKELNLEINDGIDDASYAKADAMLENIKNGCVVGEEKIRSMLIACVELDPWLVEIYIYATIYFGDSQKDLDKIAEHYGICLQDWKIARLGEDILDEVLETDDLEELKREMDKRLTYYGIQSERFVQWVEALDDENVDEVQDSAMDSNKNVFHFLGERIKISNEDSLYNWLLGEYKDLAREKSSKLRKLYNDAPGIDAVASKVENWGIECLTEVAQKTLDILGRAEIYTVDINVINSQYIKHIDFTPWNMALEAFEDKYVSCMYSEEQMKTYRAQRKANRGRFVGGGFGVSGAIKGSMQAGALNVATGLAHSVVNTIGNVSSDLHISSNKDKLYRSRSTIEELCLGLSSTVSSMINIFTEVLYQERGQYVGPKSTQDVEAVQAIVNNIKAGRLPKESIRDALVQCIQLYYYNEDIYYLAINYFGDSDKEIERIAEYFWIDVTEMKNKIFQATFKEVEYIIDMMSYDAGTTDYQKAKDKFIQQENYLGFTYPDRSNILHQLDEEIDFCNLPMRIVGGKLYETKEAADAARDDLEKIYRIASDKKLTDEQALETVNALQLDTVDMQNERGQILLNRRKLLCGDIDQFSRKLHEIKYETVDLAHSRNLQNRRYCAIYDGYLKDRYFDSNSDKFERVKATFEKATSFGTGEKACVFITCLKGILLNNSGFVLTNKRLYFISGKKIAFQTELPLVDQISAKESKFVVYTKDSKIFSFEMQDLDAPYAIGVMNQYFSKIVAFFRELYGGAVEQEKKESCEGQNRLDSNIQMAFVDAYKILFKRVHSFIWVYKSNAVDSIILTAEDNGFSEEIENMKLRLGQRLMGEISAVLIRDESQDGNGILITNQHIYFTTEKQKQVPLNEIVKISNEGKINTKIIFELANGNRIVHVQYPKAFWGREREYTAILQVAVNASKKFHGMGKQHTDSDENSNLMTVEICKTLFEKVHRFNTEERTKDILLTMVDEEFSEELEYVCTIRGIKLFNEVPLLIMMERERAHGGGILITNGNMYVVGMIQVHVISISEIEDIFHKETISSSETIVFKLKNRQVKHSDYLDVFWDREDEYVDILKEAVRASRTLNVQMRNSQPRIDRDRKEKPYKAVGLKEEAAEPLQKTVETVKEAAVPVEKVIEPPKRDLELVNESTTKGTQNQTTLSDGAVADEQSDIPDNRTINKQGQEENKVSEKYQYCLQCGNQILVGKNFCSKCGNPLLVQKGTVTKEPMQLKAMICPKCNNVVKPGKKFCSICGTKIQN